MMTYDEPRPSLLSDMFFKVPPDISQLDLNPLCSLGALRSPLFAHATVNQHNFQTRHGIPQEKSPDLTLGSWRVSMY